MTKFFDVVRKMVDTDNKALRLAPMENVSEVRKTKQGCQVTICVGEDILYKLSEGKLVGGLLYADREEVHRIGQEMDLQAFGEAHDAAFTLEEFWKQQGEWSQATFGSDQERGPIGPLKHLAKEAKEAQEKPEDIMEYVDCLFLVVDAARRAGFTCDQILYTAFEKLEINKRRKWPKGKADEAVEHDRSEEKAQ